MKCLLSWILIIAIMTIHNYNSNFIADIFDKKIFSLNKNVDMLKGLTNKLNKLIKVKFMYFSRIEFAVFFHM